jgi:transposase
MSKKTRRGRRSFTDEFKAEAVAVVRNSGKSIGRIAQDLDLTETALRDWVRQAEGTRAGAAPIAEDERGELRRLREEVRVLRMERDFLKKAAAFFAKESK